MPKTKLIHFGCSFAMGNGIPRYIPNLPSKIPHTGTFSKVAHRLPKDHIELKEYNVEPQKPYTCGNYLADKLGFNFLKIAQDGSSNERIFRKLLETNLKNARVLIGITSDNRREGLASSSPIRFSDRRRERFTVSRATSHWQTWKIVEPGMPTKHKDLVFDPWKKEYFPAVLEECQIKTVIQIIYMQNFLKANNIPYLMFNAMWNGFDKPKTIECTELLKKVDKKYFYNLQGTFDDCQYGWCVKEKLYVSDADNHPNLQGQIAWGEKLLPMAEKVLINNNDD